MFADCLLQPASALTHVDLLFNRIGMIKCFVNFFLYNRDCVGNDGASILKPALGPENKKVVEFLVDISIDLEVFKEIFRRDAGGKKKKGKGGAKKKK